MTDWRYYRQRPGKAHRWVLTMGGLWRSECRRLWVADLHQTTCPLAVENERIPKCKCCMPKRKKAA